MRRLLSLLLTISAYTLTYAQLSTKIRLNQIGFYPYTTKTAVIVGTSTNSTFTIKSVDRTKTHYTGTISTSSTWAFSGESVRTANFTDFTTPGSYVIDVAGIGYSYTFKISDKVFVPLSKAVMKAYYHNRCSFSTTNPYAIDPTSNISYARNAGHPDNSVQIHCSASSTTRPAGTIVSSVGGWYDAGDYNSYIINSGITTYELMTAYEQFKSYYDTLNLNIPESGGTYPDILDEVKYNLDWMLTMQDPNDGGVYTKKTASDFTSFDMPENDFSTRYLVKKSTTAAFDFAAVMAVAYRVYKPYNTTYANNCLSAATKAYNWGIANSNIQFTNPTCTPSINTGEYGDISLADEKEWAATEMYISTLTDTYYSNSFKNTNTYSIPDWANVNTLGLMSLINNRKNLTSIALADTSNMIAKLVGIADVYKNHQQTSSAYKVAQGAAGNADFPWGSNGWAANIGLVLMNTYKCTGTKSYYEAAFSNFDYILGRNATGYSFVTSYGSKPPLNIHHRQSAGDGITAPVPGWVAGGPTDATGGDGCPTSSTYIATSYSDLQACYSKNEIAINWNAPMVYLSAAVEYLKPAPTENIAPIANADNMSSSPITLGNDLGTVAILANDSDANGTPSTLSGHIIDLDVSTPNTQESSITLSNGSWVYNSTTGILNYTPVSNFIGTANLVYALIDAGGLNDTAIVTFKVLAPNTVPVANDDNLSSTPLLEDGANGTVSILTNDTDPEGNPTTTSGHIVDLNPSTTAVETSITNAQGVWIYSTTTGILTFDPANNYFGTATLTYKLTDAGGLSDNALVTFVVSSVNDAPIANDDNQSNKPLTVNAANGTVSILTNDTDVDGNPTTTSGHIVDLNPSTISVETTITNAQGVWTYSTSTGVLTFDPSTDYIGTATLTYSLTDAGGLSDNAIVTFVVQAVSTAPKGIGDNFNDNKLSCAWKDNSSTGSMFTILENNARLLVLFNSIPANSYESFYMSIPVTDISANPILKINAIVDYDVDMRIDLIDINGNATNSNPISKAVTNTNTTFTYNFTGLFQQSYPNTQIVDPSKIVGIVIMINPGSLYDYTGNGSFDNLQLGTGGVQDGGITNCTTLSVETQNINSSISISPNPSSNGHFKVSSSSNVEEVIISDVLGRTETFNSSDIKTSLKGLLFVTVKTSTGTITKKVVAE